MLSDALFLKHWQNLPLPAVKGPVLLAVSGGADSMVMARLFVAAGIATAIAHCNFGLRGADSEADEELVRKFAAAADLPFHRAAFDTRTESARAGKGIQETARDLRYTWLKEVRATHNYACICTAHHQDDVAETVLLNLARGTGIAGLHGIRPVQGLLVRPLLPFSKADIVNYANEKRLVFRDDVSNEGDDYTRNALRHHVLPRLEEIIPGAPARIAASAQRIGEAEVIYRRGIEAERKKLIEQRGKDFYIPLRLLRQRTPLATVVYELFRPFGFTSAQTPGLIRLMTAESGRRIDSGTHLALHNRDFIIITAKEPAEADIIMIAPGAQHLQTREGDFAFSGTVPPRPILTDTTICQADAARLEYPLLLRRWKTGDYFYPLGMNGKKKKLSRFFIDQKIPLHKKDRIRVLESNRRIVWVCGHRMDERFKITPATQKILEVRLIATGTTDEASAPESAARAQDRPRP